jgi:hypothetical protein
MTTYIQTYLYMFTHYKGDGHYPLHDGAGLSAEADPRVPVPHVRHSPAQ